MFPVRIETILIERLMDSRTVSLGSFVMVLPSGEG